MTTELPPSMTAMFTPETLMKTVMKVKVRRFGVVMRRIFREFRSCVVKFVSLVLVLLMLMNSPPFTISVLINFRIAQVREGTPVMQFRPIFCSSKYLAYHPPSSSSSEAECGKLLTVGLLRSIAQLITRLLLRSVNVPFETINILENDFLRQS
ncbi:hypothetical protein RND81_11G088700 [Saponaria officinalis]|uniref:Uncharacterized protein n=1 Tax=Saponaria officinalis TaxID=3572 RepID=A0AAW1HIR0_SAPOF